MERLLAARAALPAIGNRRVGLPAAIAGRSAISGRCPTARTAAKPTGGLAKLVESTSKPARSSRSRRRQAALPSSRCRSRIAEVCASPMRSNDHLTLVESIGAAERPRDVSRDPAGLEACHCSECDAPRDHACEGARVSFEPPFGVALRGGSTNASSNLDVERTPSKVSTRSRPPKVIFPPPSNPGACA